jgi:YgiT-type zinc finger domain-containing protein
MICVLCGKAKLVSETKDTPITYKGHTTRLHNIDGD